MKAWLILTCASLLACSPVESNLNTLEPNEQTAVAAVVPQVEQFVNQFLAGFQALPAVSASMQVMAATDCISFGGNLTDADGDGFPKNAIITYTKCEIFDSRTRWLSSGSLVFHDRDDAVKSSGFTLAGTIKQFESPPDPIAPVERVEVESQISMIFTPLPGGSNVLYKATTQKTYAGNTTGVSGNEGSVLELQTTNLTDADRKGQTLEFTGSASYEALTRSARVPRYRSESRFSGKLHQSFGKNGCNGIDDGAVTYESGSFSRTVKYAPCNRQL
jgi:hypothetical protein